MVVILNMKETYYTGTGGWEERCIPVEWEMPWKRYNNRSWVTDWWPSNSREKHRSGPYLSQATSGNFSHRLWDRKVSWTHSTGISEYWVVPRLKRLMGSRWERETCISNIWSSSCQHGRLQAWEWPDKLGFLGDDLFRSRISWRVAGLDERTLKTHHPDMRWEVGYRVILGLVPHVYQDNKFGIGREHHDGQTNSQFLFFILEENLGLNNVSIFSTCLWSK